METLLRLFAAPASSGDMPELHIIEHNLAFIWFFSLPSIRTSQNFIAFTPRY
jgi:hypothetical protein